MAIILSFKSLTAFDIHGWKTDIFRIYYTVKQLECQLQIQKKWGLSGGRAEQKQPDKLRFEIL